MAGPKEPCLQGLLIKNSVRLSYKTFCRGRASAEVGLKLRVRYQEDWGLLLTCICQLKYFPCMVACCAIGPGAAPLNLVSSSNPVQISFRSHTKTKSCFYKCEMHKAFWSCQCTRDLVYKPGHSKSLLYRSAGSILCCRLDLRQCKHRRSTCQLEVLAFGGFGGGV